MDQYEATDIIMDERIRTAFINNEVIKMQEQGDIVSPFQIASFFFEFGVKIHQQFLSTDVCERNISREQRYEVLKRQKWKCNICSLPLKYNCRSGWDGAVAHIDHIFPYSKRYEYPKGASRINELNNLQALCPNCNLKKSNNKVN